MNEREKRYRKKQAERGLKRVSVWVPVDKVNEVTTLAHGLRERQRRESTGRV